MNSEKIVSFERAVQVAELSRIIGQHSVFLPGVYDLRHKGHDEFIKTARTFANITLVGVENDETVRKNKGPNRPIQTLKERLESLSNLAWVDIVFALPGIPHYIQGVDILSFYLYIERLRALNPTFLGIPANDPNREVKISQLSKTATKPKFINHNFTHLSTTNIIKMRNQL